MVKKRSVAFFLLFLLPGSFLLNCRNDRVVARVGNKIIRASDFKASFLADKSEKQAKSFSYTKRLDHLNKMIDDDLELIAAHQESLDQDSVIIGVLKEREKRLVYQYVIDHDILSKVAPESRVRDIYKKMAKEIKVSQIFIPSPKDTSRQKRDEIRSQLNRIRSRIMHGESFDALARRFSKDSLTAGKGGDLGFIKWGGKVFSPAIYNVIFKMKAGEVSHPLSAKDGYRLIKVDKIRKVHLAPYTNLRSKIRQSIFDKNRKQLYETSQQLLRKFKKTYSVKYNDKNLDNLLSKVDKERQEAKDKSVNIIKFKYIDGNDRDRPLVEYRGGKFTTGQFVDRFRKMNPFKSPPLNSKEQVEKYLERLYPADLVVLWGYDRGYQRTNKVKKALAKKKDDLILAKTIRENIDDKIDVSEEQCRRFYRKNKGKYYTPATFKIQEILVKSRKTADKVYAMALKKQNFSTLVKKYNTRSSTKKKNGILGYINKNQYGRIGKVAARMKVGDISKPVKIGMSYSVFKLLDIRPRKEKNFKQVQNQIKAELRKTLRKKREKEWLTGLRKKIPVLIYESNLKNALG